MKRRNVIKGLLASILLPAVPFNRLLDDERRPRFAHIWAPGIPRIRMAEPLAVGDFGGNPDAPMGYLIGADEAAGPMMRVGTIILDGSEP